MNKKFNRSLMAGYGFSILILLLVGFISYNTLQRLLTSNRAVAHSSHVIQNLEHILSHMKDAETGQRGFLLTGRRDFLAPYRGAANEALKLAGETQDITRDDITQQKNLASIREIITKRLAILQTLIDKRNEGIGIRPNDLDAGKAAMDALRAAIAKAEKTEQGLLRNRTEQLNRYSSITPPFILGALIIAVLIALASYFKAIGALREKDKLYTELYKHQEETASLNEELTAANEELTAINEEVIEAREELQTANENLEEKVKERTAALAESEEETQALNEELTAINEELAAANEELQTTNDTLAQNERHLQVLLDEMTLAEERSAKLAAIVESSDDAIIGKSLEGVITSWNRGAEQIFGYKDAEVVGESILTLIPEHLQHEEPEILARLRRGERIDHYETTRRAKDGRLIDVALTISPIRNKNGEVTGVSKIARDITERKRDEQRKNDFIGMASHELKTPLTSLTALLQVVQLKLKNNADEFIINALDRTNLQARRMARLINGFLNISRLESGKLSIDRQHFELNGLINEMIGEMKLIDTSERLTFTPTAPITINADREKIGSVISNLLSNALKYSPKDKQVQVELQNTPGELIISVRDEGMGINPADLDKIFDRYYRVQDDVTRHISGFGVGLYLSAEIVQRHNGRIWAESQQGSGSTFYFALPVS